MEHFSFWGLIPPLLTILLALITKDVIIALIIGILSGTFMVYGGNPILALMGLSDMFADSLNDGWNLRIYLFTAILGALVGMLSQTGSAYAFGQWASSKIKTKKGALLFTWVFGIIIFIDDYFNSLTIGTVMKPLTDRTKVSRAKLAYILDSTAAPVVIMAPISSWVVYVMSVIKDSDGFASFGVSELIYFVKVIPFNLYAIFAVLMVGFITLTKKDFGPMAISEKRAEDDLGLYNEEKFGPIAGKIEGTDNIDSSKAKPIDMLLPIILLIALAVTFFPLTTWISSVDGEEIKTIGEAMEQIPVGDAFNDTDSSKAMLYATVLTLILTYIYYIARRLLTIKTSAEAILNGIKSMVPALIILTLAWSIGGLIKNSPAEGGLGLTTYLSEVVSQGNFPLWLLPAVVFIISCLLSFSTGTSWGTFAIMIPITIPIAIALASKMGLEGPAVMNATLVPIGAILGGAIFGDHSSPISDTTILSSTGAGVPHLEHVATQVPYAIFVAISALFGHIVGGITHNVFLSLLTTGVLFVLGIIFIPKLWKIKVDSK